MKKELKNIQEQIFNIQVKIDKILNENNLPLETYSDIAFALKKLVEANSWLEKAISQF